MKKTAILFLLLSVVLLGQSYQINLNMFEPFTASEFAAFGASRNLGQAPRVFSLEITPEGELVWLDVAVEWKDPDKNFYEQLFTFSTEKFIARTIYNDEFGNTLDMINYQTNDDLIDENIFRGQPTGYYRITVVLHTDAGQQAMTVKELEFLNPAQTLSLQLPVDGATYDPGNVTAIWDRLPGVENYIVRAAVKDYENQGTEDALNSGSLIIDNVDVGDVTEINIREYLESEWLPGDEVVFQVYAKIEGPGSGTGLYSEVVNFYIRNEEPADFSEINDGLAVLTQYFPTEEEKNIIADFINGEFGNIKSITVGDKIITREELAAILDSLNIDPDKIISIKVTEE